MKDMDVAEVNYKRYIRARDNGHKAYLDEADKCLGFYEGEQWSEQDRKTLEEEGRPALTINKILSTVNTLLGRADYTTGFVPGEDSKRGF